jgi:hypothetical protein
MKVVALVKQSISSVGNFSMKMKVVALVKESLSIVS